MDKRKEKYYNYVVNDLVKKTEIDYDGGRIYTPFFPPYSPHSSPLVFLSFTSPPLSFSDHGKGVYGLTYREIKYVWKEYGKIIKYKVNNG